MIKFFAKTLIYTLSLLSINTAMADSYSYWLNGFRKDASLVKDIEDTFVVETPHYIFSLSPHDLTSSYFAPSKAGFKYGDYGFNYKDLEKLKKYPLDISIKVGGDKYVARQSRAGKRENTKPLQDVLLWESGRHFHRYEFKDVDFVNSKGEALPLYSDLMFTAWDNVFTLSLNTQKDIFYKEGAVDGVVGVGHCIENTKLFIPASQAKFDDEFTISLWIKTPNKFWQVSNANGGVIFGGKTWGGAGGWGLRVEDIFRYTAFLRSSTLVESGTVTAKDGWNLFTLTYSSGTLNFYINNKQVSKATNPSFKPLNEGITIASNAARNNTVVSMLVDEVRFWDKALGASDIAAMHKSPETIPAQSNLVYENNFNDGKVVAQDLKDLKNAEIEMSLLKHKASKKLTKDLALGEKENLVLPVYIKKAEPMEIKVSRKGSPLTVEFDEEKQCYKTVVSNVSPPKGSDGKCYYEDFHISVKGRGEVPFLLHLQRPGAITGLMPTLCYKDGTPTGIQVQLSKNWHHQILKSYMMAYAQIPQGEYIMRISYGWYGQYPSSSHSNLSLVGYGGSGRWEQLAIGAWGESICFDADNSLVTNMVTDIRMLMARDGANGKMWGWTDAGWGADWVNISVDGKKRLMPVGMKVAYKTQGPCMTDVTYESYLGVNREISMKARIEIARSGDYLRTFHTLDYKFNEDVEADAYSLYNMRNLSKTIALGDGSGAVVEYEEQGRSTTTHSFGGEKYPIWFSAMGRVQKNHKSVGYKALVIRSFDVKVGGKSYKVPEVVYNGTEMNLVLPDKQGKISFKKGDTISMRLELITLHARAEDYYGTDQDYIKHLEENPMSYKTAQRQAFANNLQVQVKGGELLRSYPIEILAKDKEVAVEIQGGVGLCPIRVLNMPNKDYNMYQVLDNGKLEKLDQSSSYGNDYYQLEYDIHTKTYAYVYNLPLREGKTKWILKK